MGKMQWSFLHNLIIFLNTYFLNTVSRESLGFIPHHTGSFTVRSDIIAFCNPPQTFHFLSWRGLAAGVAAVVLLLCCSVIAPSCLGRGYFWLPPCLNPVVILRWIIHASSTPQHLLPLSPHLLSSHPLPFTLSHPLL